MAGVGLVLDQHLPVAAVHVAQWRAFQDQPAFRRAVDHIVDGREAVAEEALEVRPAVVQLDEDEIAIDPEILHRRQAAAHRHVLEAGAVVSLAQRHGEQRAVGPERPAVIGAAEHLAGIAAGLARDARALVGAAVVVDVDLAVGMAGDQQHRPRCWRTGAPSRARTPRRRYRRRGGPRAGGPARGWRRDRCGSESRAPAWPAAPLSFNGCHTTARPDCIAPGRPTPRR